MRRLARLLSLLAAALLAAPPAFAQAERRPPHAGDTWTYRLSEPGRSTGPKERRYEVTAVEASPAKVVERYSVEGGPSGEWTHAPGAHLISIGASVFSPYLAAFQDLSRQTPLDRIEIADRACGGRTFCEVRARVIGPETVVVPAGSFDAIKVQISHAWRGMRGVATTGGVPAGSRLLTVWYAPSLTRAVKFSSRPTGGSNPPLEVYFDLELVSYKMEQATR